MTETIAVSDVFVSVVAPLRNDADIVAEFVEQTVGVLEAHYRNYELVLVDDGSQDDTGRIVPQLLERFACIRYIRLSRRFGQEIAIAAGLDTVIGDFVVVMLPDSDPTDLIPELVSRSRAGAGVVFGQRASRKTDPFWLRLGAGLFYWICNHLLGMNIPGHSTHFRVLSRQAVNAVLRMGDRTRYLRTLSAYVGYGSQALEYEPISRRARPRRKSPIEALRLAIDIVVSNSTRPLRLVSYVGLVMSLLFLLYIGYIVLIYLFKPDVAEGWVTLSAQSAVAFFFIFLLLTVFAEYLSALLGELKERPLYFVLDEKNSAGMLVDQERRNVVDRPVEEA